MFYTREIRFGDVTIRHDESDAILVLDQKNRGYQLVFDDLTETSRTYTKIITATNPAQYARAVFNSVQYQAKTKARDVAARKAAGVEE